MLPFFGPGMIEALNDLFRTQPVWGKKMPAASLVGKIVLTTGHPAGSALRLQKRRPFGAQ